MSRKRKYVGEAGSFVMVRKEMRESPAWAVASDNVRRLLDRLEVEHMRHAGRANGKLGVTYDGFAEWGLGRRGCALAILEAVELGFLEVTATGGKSWGDFKHPSTYRLTYVWSARRDGVSREPTDEWERIGTADEADAALARARARTNDRSEKRRARKAAKEAAKLAAE